MARPERVYFLADMHLKPLDAPDETARAAALKENQTLADFLEFIQDKASSLILLGDTFNFWFERKGRVAGDFGAPLALLKAAADSGIAIHHVSGNRDFVIGSDTKKNGGWPGFLPNTSPSRLTDYGIRPHGPRYALRHAGRNILCVHGDAFCLSDKPFMLLRSLLQGPVGRAFWGHAPFPLVEAIVRRQQARLPLMRQTPRSGDIFDKISVCRQIVMGYDRILCGHIHREYERKITLPGNISGSLTALPPWLEQGYAYLEGTTLTVTRFTAR